ncbi:MAG: flagellar motor protein MotB [Alphaproteobacteria bacterium]
MADEAPKAEGGAAPSGGGGGAAGNVIIIKKKNRGGHGGHHGGAWKVAYADFVTAMMAFFLLLWLLATTSEEQKQGIASYFNPPNNATEYGGGTGIMGGSSPVAVDMHANEPTPVLPPADPNPQDMAVQAKEEAMFRQVSESLVKAMMNIPQLKAMLDNVLIDVTPEGLRIQIVDKAGRPMFVEGTAEPYDYTKLMLSVVSNVLAGLPNQLALGGHTHGVPFRGPSPAYTNWELSTDRANVTRRIMVDEGINDKRIKRVAGYAAQELLVVDSPADPKNTRISIIVLRSKKGAVAAFNQDGLLPVGGY